jgi:hypothetical protein
VTIRPNFTSHNGWTNCHRRLDQLSQVTISPPTPGVDEKFVDLTIQGPKRCGSKSSRVQLLLGPTVWVELSLGLNVGRLNVKTPFLYLSQLRADTYVNINITLVKLGYNFFLLGKVSATITVRSLVPSLYIFLPCKQICSDAAEMRKENSSCQ